MKLVLKKAWKLFRARIFLKSERGSAASLFSQEVGILLFYIKPLVRNYIIFTCLTIKMLSIVTCTQLEPYVPANEYQMALINHQNVAVTPSK